MSSSEKAFYEDIGTYQDALTKTGHAYKLTFNSNDMASSRNDPLNSQDQENASIVNLDKSDMINNILSSRNVYLRSQHQANASVVNQDKIDKTSDNKRKRNKART